MLITQMDFNVHEYKNFINTISDSHWQEYLHSPEGIIKTLCPLTTIYSICVRQDSFSFSFLGFFFLYVNQNNIFQQLKTEAYTEV